MKIKTAEATGPALRWAVAQAEYTHAGSDEFFEFMHVPYVRDVETGNRVPCEPDTDWSQGGPIIEREGISTVFQGDAHDWVASLWSYPTSDWVLHTEGPTPLIAAMRCYVASKLGDEVDIPEELT